MRLADLRQVLQDMEHDLGLAGLSRTETDVLCAAAKIVENKDTVTVVELQLHSLLRDMPRATFFRALRNLVARGFLEKLGDEKRAGYAVRIG